MTSVSCRYVQAIKRNLLKQANRRKILDLSDEK